MARDVLTVVVDPAHYVRWPNGGGYQPVALQVNGVDLIDLVAAAERPFAGDNAGAYLHLNGGDVFPPSRNLLGEPYRHGFGIPADDRRNRQSLLLQCTCGITDCWFLLATI